ncbi:hypothetical protein LOZ30_004076 [Ophidiomyces ophidiicola]|nr:hypothetical protein LOZ30_004076 [Ophidiomyces ophidiicola]
MAIGSMLRAPRISPDVALHFEGWTIPKGVSARGGAKRGCTQPTDSQPDSRVDVQLLDAPRRWRVPEPRPIRAGTLVLPWRAAADHAEPLCAVCEGVEGVHGPEVRVHIGVQADTDSLVYMQLYHTLAELYRPGAPRLRLFQTDASDVVPKHGLLFPFPKLASVGVRVAVESRAD